MIKKIKKSQDLDVNLPGGAHAIASLGYETEKVISTFYKTSIDNEMFGKEIVNQDILKHLAESLKGWTDHEAAIVVNEFYKNISEKNISFEISGLCRWVLSHPNDSRAVLDCMSVNPPNDISIIKVLSRAGSQKLVFLATWRLTQRQVVVKRLIGSQETRNPVLAREMQSHPLTMDHPNIMKTHFLKNDKGEEFLVEEYLPDLLNPKLSDFALDKKHPNGLSCC